MQKLLPSVLYFHHWKKWVLATVLRLAFLGCLPVLILAGIVGDSGIVAVKCLYPEGLLPLLISGATGEIPNMSGEALGVLVLLDTLIGGYLLNVAVNIKEFRRGNRNAGSRKAAGSGPEEI